MIVEVRAEIARVADTFGLASEERTRRDASSDCWASPGRAWATSVPGDFAASVTLTQLSGSSSTPPWSG